ICCGSGGPARNGHYSSAGELYKTIPPTTPEDCCRACYKDSICDSYEFIIAVDYDGNVAKAVCNFYKGSDCNLGWVTSTDAVEYGVVNCGFFCTDLTETISPIRNDKFLEGDFKPILSDIKPPIFAELINKK
ncbi:4569_t:CDS:2, partial [Racocetra fulgida]